LTARLSQGLGPPTAPVSSGCPQPGLTQLQPGHLGLGLGNQQIGHHQLWQVPLAFGLGLVAGVLLQQLQGGGALAPDHLERGAVAGGHRGHQLDQQLVADQAVAGDRGGEPVGQGRPAGRGDLVGLATLGIDLPGGDQAVAFQSGQGGVDLADVQRPTLAQPPLYGGLELVAVVGPVVQQ
jgi:hypothetical protein